MGSMSIWHWILVLAVGLLLFGGRGKISELMGDFAKGIKSFKKGLTEEEKAETEPVKTDPKTIDHQPAPAPTATVTLRTRGSEGGLRIARLSELKPPCSRSVGASSCSSASSR
jgi:sec-independent protein translocase protein TatA